MDELLRQAIERRELLRRELAALDRFIADYAPVVAPPPPSLDRSKDLFSFERKKRADHAADLRAMMDEAERLILKEGRPLSRSELLKRLQERGHRVIGGDKSKVLGTNLWRSGRFHSLKGFGYWPKVSPIPQAYKDAERRD